MITPYYVEIALYQGTTFDPVFVLKNPDGSLVNLTGKTGLWKVYKNKGDAQPVITFSTADGSLVFGGVNGTMQPIYPAASSTPDKLPAFNGYHDLRLTDTALVRTDPLLYGPFNFKQFP